MTISWIAALLVMSHSATTMSWNQNGSPCSGDMNSEPSVGKVMCAVFGIGKRWSFRISWNLDKPSIDCCIECWLRWRLNLPESGQRRRLSFSCTNDHNSHCINRESKVGVWRVFFFSENVQASWLHYLMFSPNFGELGHKSPSQSCHAELWEFIALAGKMCLDQLTELASLCHHRYVKSAITQELKTLIYWYVREDHFKKTLNIEKKIPFPLPDPKSEIYQAERSN